MIVCGGFAAVCAGKFTYRSNGAGVRVYVLDTGIRYSHREFRANRYIAKGYDFVDVGGPARDCNGHGTQVSN
jgi:subtilisin family serine protease